MAGEVQGADCPARATGKAGPLSTGTTPTLSPGLSSAT